MIKGSLKTKVMYLKKKVGKVVLGLQVKFNYNNMGNDGLLKWGAETDPYYVTGEGATPGGALTNAMHNLFTERVQRDMYTYFDRNMKEVCEPALASMVSAPPAIQQSFIGEMETMLGVRE